MYKFIYFYWNKFFFFFFPLILANKSKFLMLTVFLYMVIVAYLNYDLREGVWSINSFDFSSNESIIF